MGQFSVARGDHWDVSFWLAFDSNGGVRLTRGQPDLARNERSMAMQVKVPFALFKTPTMRVTMAIEAPEPGVPPIDMTTAASALRQALGVDVDVRVVSPEE